MSGEDKVHLYPHSFLGVTVGKKVDINTDPVSKVVINRFAVGNECGAAPETDNCNEIFKDIVSGRLDHDPSKILPDICNIKTGETPLMIAAEFGKYNVVKWILDETGYPQSLNHESEYYPESLNEPPFFRAVKNGHIKTAKLLCNHDSFPTRNELMAISNYTHVNVLLTAISRGDLESVRMILEHPDCPPELVAQHSKEVLSIDGTTALMKACALGDLEASDRTFIKIIEGERKGRSSKDRSSTTSTGDYSNVSSRDSSGSPRSSTNDSGYDCIESNFLKSSGSPVGPVMHLPTPREMEDLLPGRDSVSSCEDYEISTSQNAIIYNGESEPTTKRTAKSQPSTHNVENENDGNRSPAPFSANKKNGIKIISIGSKQIVIEKQTIRKTSTKSRSPAFNKVQSTKSQSKSPTSNRNQASPSSNGNSTKSTKPKSDGKSKSKLTSNNQRILELILTSKFMTKEIFEDSTREGTTALMVASQWGQLGTVHAILGHEFVSFPYLQAKDSKGRTALDWAKVANNRDICQALETHMTHDMSCTPRDGA